MARYYHISLNIDFYLSLLFLKWLWSSFKIYTLKSKLGKSTKWKVSIHINHDDKFKFHQLSVIVGSYRNISRGSGSDGWRNNGRLIIFYVSPSLFLLFFCNFIICYNEYSYYFHKQKEVLNWNCLTVKERGHTYIVKSERREVSFPLGKSVFLVLFLLGVLLPV